MNTLILPLWHIPWISGSCMYRQLLELHRPNWMKVSKSRLSKQTLHHDIYFRGPGVCISEKYFTSFCLLINIHRLESHLNRGQFTYETTIFDAVRAQLIVKSFLKGKHALFGFKWLSSWKWRLSYILVLTGYRSLRLGLQYCHDTAGHLWPKWNTS